MGRRSEEQEKEVRDDEDCAQVTGTGSPAAP